VENISKYLNEEQDPKAVEKIYNKVKDLLTSGETIQYIAVQKKPAVTISPDCVALTNKRIIFCRPKNLGFSMEFQDNIWKEVSDCHMKEAIFGAEFTVRTVYGLNISIDYLPKVQARKLYQFAQQKEEEQRELRRQMDLEEKRAAAGGVTVTASIPSSASSTTPVHEDPIASLQKLKALLTNDLITQQEFDAKKAEILARL
jgi:uncharacterized protein YoaH (UPF0181 family)